MNNTDKEKEVTTKTTIVEEKEKKQTSDKNNTEEKEEEESLVLLQFTDLDDANYSQQFSSQLKSIDISSPSPIIQIGSRLYSGEYTNNLGTYLFFEEKPATTSSTNDASNSSNSSQFDYSGKSYKKLVLTRLFVEEQKRSSESEAAATDSNKE